jgi:hypothetical protein
MSKEAVIILAKDNVGHAGLIINSLNKTGITHDLLHFEDGEEILNYLCRVMPLCYITISLILAKVRLYQIETIF